MKRMRNGIGFAHALLLVLACAAPWPALAEADPPPYIFAVQPLGTLPGLSNFDATAINDRGHVIGNARDADGDLHAWLYDGTSLRDLVALSAVNATVSGLNNVGQIVGSAGNQAVMYSSGKVTYLAPGLASSGARAINDRGQATGWANFGEPYQRAVIFERGSVRALDRTSWWWSSIGTDINEHGDIAGTYNQPGADDVRPVLFYADGRLGTPYLDIELWSQGHAATGINDAGQMVGWLDSEVGRSAYLFENGVTHALYPISRLNTAAFDINDRGQVVGNIGIWEPNGLLYTPEDLMPEDSPWRISELELINDRGQVVATACLGSDCQLVLLSPVPEPGMIAMLGVGLALIGAIAARSSRSAGIARHSGQSLPGIAGSLPGLTQ